MGNHVEEGRSWRAKILDIKPANELGGDSNDPVAITRSYRNPNGIRTEKIGWFPLNVGHGFRLGQQVQITPVTESIGKGSHTTFRVEMIGDPLSPAHLLTRRG